MHTQIAHDMVYLDSMVLSLDALSSDTFVLVIDAPPIARAASPGQFVQVRVAEKSAIDPLLARPISIFRVDTERGEISLIFKVVGRGTALLATVTPGRRLTVQGPIGNGFSVPESCRRLTLVGGGVGMPPLFFLAETLRRDRPTLDIIFFYGGRTRADLLMLAEWQALGVTVATATDDGSHGHHGLVTEPLHAAIAEQRVDFIAACGPRPMLRAVQQLAMSAGIPGQLSLEARMACGVGACLGCVCGTIHGRRRVCVDGPVFPLEEVTFDA